MVWIFAATALGLGAIVGSFLNVVIHRVPRGESIVFPASHCPHCNTDIKAYDNVPVLSFLLLRARCRTCREPISWRYPLIELANGLLYLAIYERTGPTLGFVAVAALVSMTLVLIYIALEIQILPDVIDLPGIAIGLGVGALHLGALYPDLLLSRTFFESLTGAAVGAGMILVIRLTYQLIRGIEGMGLGDVKMMAMLGAVLGWEPLFPLLLLASLTGAIIGLALAAKTGKGLQIALPFGVFLGLAFLIILFFGQELSRWYVMLLLR
jgi:leader peptidase (prepilin peptidase)/N-methyltransferase